MRFVAVLALLLVAVSAKEHFKQPKYPCAYNIKISVSEKGEKVEEFKIYVNGRYLKMKMTSEERDYSSALLLRPDIGGEGNCTLMNSFKDYCYPIVVETKEASYIINTYSVLFLMYVDDKDWDHKETKTWRGKKCDHYYDDDDDESIYVYDGRIYGYAERSDEITFEYEWEAPMEEFVMKEKDYPYCVEAVKEVSEVPSEDYIFCAASSVKVAFVAIVVALVSSLF